MWGEFKPAMATRGLKNIELLKSGIPVMWNITK